jgi:dTDP-4-amino-4,6-dideoxygalactose transaminase
MAIPFNKPFITGNEAGFISDVIANRKLSGDGKFTKLCQFELERRLQSGRSFLTTSCTDALEAAAILCNIQPGDEVIVPSFTFVSTANAFALRGAKIRFADSLPSQPNLDHDAVAELITPRTRAIVPVHYAGVACDMGALNSLGDNGRIFIVEDAAQAISSTYQGRPLGTLGDFGAFSFHETKNIVSGEGGALHVNRSDSVARAEIVREKGTNRSSFFRGEVDKYGWVDIGSSFLPSELISAFLFAQLEALEEIQARRVAVWEAYDSRLSKLSDRGGFSTPFIPEYASNNAHMYYIVMNTLEDRNRLINHLKFSGIQATFHYQALHASKFFSSQHDGRPLPQSLRYTDCLVRLPLFANLDLVDVEFICNQIESFVDRYF